MTGQDNLNNTNIVQILLNPMGFISLIVYLILLVVLLFLEYQVFCLMILGASNQKKIAWKELFHPTHLKLNKQNIFNGLYF